MALFKRKYTKVDAKTGLKVMETLRDLEYGVAAICGGMWPRWRAGT